MRTCGQLRMWMRLWVRLRLWMRLWRLRRMWRLRRLRWLRQLISRRCIAAKWMPRLGIRLAVKQTPTTPILGATSMSAVAVENLLALFYTNPSVRKDFEAHPEAMLAEQDLTSDERASLLAMDWPGLTLAGNSFGYKRWKANQWRHGDAYLFTAYEDIFTEDDLSPVRAIFQQRIASQKVSTTKLRSTHPGMISELLKVMPENQINHEHVLLENPRLSSVCALWRRLTELHLHTHYLIRAYFLRVCAEGSGPMEAQHARPGACITYVPLSGPGTPEAHVTAAMRDGKTICREPLQAGRCITYPADVAQRIEVGAGADLQQHGPVDVLCIKTLCAGV